MLPESRAHEARAWAYGRPSTPATRWPEALAVRPDAFYSFASADRPPIRRRETKIAVKMSDTRRIDVAKFNQICTSQNDLFALDEEGEVYQYNFNTKKWVKLIPSRSDEPFASNETKSHQTHENPYRSTSHLGNH
jgi:hypothetical protein